MKMLTELFREQSPGKVEWLGVAAEKRGAMDTPETITLESGRGIIGEHHFRHSGSSRRQVTLIQHEHLSVIAALSSDPERVSPVLLRRNIVVSGINLTSLRDRRFRIGSAVLVGTGPCPPCSRMEENLGPGGYAAMMGHGGLTAIVDSGGMITVGDVVTALEFA